MSKLLLKPLGRLNVSTRRALACTVADAAQTTTVAVLVNPEGDLYVLTRADATLAIHAYATWLVGCYDRHVTVTDIADDLCAHEYELVKTPRTRRPRQRVGGDKVMS